MYEIESIVLNNPVYLKHQMLSATQSKYESDLSITTKLYLRVQFMFLA